MNDDLFRLTEKEFEELPNSMKQIMNVTQQDMVLNLFHVAKRPLSINEVIIGMYKKYNVKTKSRTNASALLYRMFQKGLLVKHDRRNFKLPNDSPDWNV